MIDIIQEIEDLKSYVAGCASTNELYTTYPPQHPWAAGTTVEQVISRIDQLEKKIIADQEEQQKVEEELENEFKSESTGRSAAARLLRQTIDHSEISGEYYTRLLAIANMIEQEVASANKNEINIPFGVAPSCKNLITYIKSYVEANGPCTDRFIQGLYEYIDQIDTQIVNLSSENATLRKENEVFANRSKLLMRIHDIIDRN